MRPVLATLALLWLVFTMAAAGDDAARKELKLLAGKWKLTAMEIGGEKFPADKLPEFSFTLDADGIAKVKTPEEDVEVTLKVNPAKKPKTIEVDHQTGQEKGKKQLGIYKLEGDRFTVITTIPGGEESNRPKDFDSSKVKTPLMVFERVKGK
ncbi:MAG: TIGR03067 domain-containing protein [Planctomycetes bacterium]|nr:TIGR03067 domain-containing protein [Planctomycetota bacterium]